MLLRVCVHDGWGDRLEQIFNRFAALQVGEQHHAFLLYPYPRHEPSGAVVAPAWLTLGPLSRCEPARSHLVCRLLCLSVVQEEEQGAVSGLAAQAVTASPSAPPAGTPSTGQCHTKRGDY